MEVEKSIVEQIKPTVGSAIQRKAQSSKTSKAKRSATESTGVKGQSRQVVPNKGKISPSISLALPNRPISNPSESRAMSPEVPVKQSEVSIPLVYDGSSEGSVHHIDAEDDEEDMVPVNTFEDEDQG